MKEWGVDTAAVVIGVPVHKRPDSVEAFALRHNASMLAGYRFCLICPEDLDAQAYQSLLPDAAVMRVPSGEMSSWPAYNTTLCSEPFYRRFASSQFLLVLQLDALVLDATRFDSWLRDGYDYVGPPWFSRGTRNKGQCSRPEEGWDRRGVAAKGALVPQRPHWNPQRATGRAVARDHSSLYRNPKWKLSYLLRQPHSWEGVTSLAMMGALSEDQFWALPCSSMVQRLADAVTESVTAVRVRPLSAP